MLDNHSKGVSYAAGFFILIAFAIAALVFANEIASPVWKAMTGKTMDAIKNGMIGPEDSNAMKVIQTITAIVGFFIPAVVAAFVLNRKPFKLLGFSSDIKPAQAGLVILIILSGMIVSSSLAYLNNIIPVPASWKITFQEMENEYNQQVETIISLKNSTDYILALIVMGFLPALCEETLFRGGLQNFLTRSTKTPWLSIVVVSILFSLAHISFYGFLSRFFLGIILGTIYHYSGRLWLSILAHFVNNAAALTLLYAYTQNGKPLQQALESEAESFWGFLLLPVVVALFILFKRISVANKKLA
jgi:CAAX protease family protein